MKPVIRVSHLTKGIGKKDILKDISFDVYPGDCLALIGPNGAGKSTLLNCLLGDWKTKPGQVMRSTPSLGVLFQQNSTESNLKVKELLRFQQQIYNNPLSTQEIDELLGFTDEQKNQFAEKLSGGQRRLLGFVQVLIGQPDLILLDEPTAGMDTSTRKRFWEIIARLKAAGKTIIYSSHYIEEVEHTADRILVLHQGRLLRDTTPYAMRQEDKEKCFTLPRSYRDGLVSLENIYDIEENGDTLRFATKDVEGVWENLMQLGCSLSEIEMTNRSLLSQVFATAGEEKEDENI
ncbi:ABC transporter ATP-binding protein [Streptococcus sp. DD13]|uniref:ABC transporter ATP-binding protein n=1 Tax=Streptococcus sp. DD13 TaxID=1777881 RepID=UPI0007995DA6|nr:ABC transporter ATP-binding protein [Streptococcus sp. DD13]KXT79231.1 ABC transporter, ATP-binding protein [Streptococcus sp. DD13]